jgi:hypothetical protein
MPLELLSAPKDFEKLQEQRNIFLGLAKETLSEALLDRVYKYEGNIYPINVEDLLAGKKEVGESKALLQYAAIAKLTQVDDPERPVEEPSFWVKKTTITHRAKDTLEKIEECITELRKIKDRFLHKTSFNSDDIGEMKKLLSNPLVQHYIDLLQALTHFGLNYLIDVKDEDGKHENRKKLRDEIINSIGLLSTLYDYAQKAKVKAIRYQSKRRLSNPSSKAMVLATSSEEKTSQPRGDTKNIASSSKSRKSEKEAEDKLPTSPEYDKFLEKFKSPTAVINDYESLDEKDQPPATVVHDYNSLEENEGFLVAWVKKRKRINERDTQLAALGALMQYAQEQKNIRFAYGAILLFEYMLNGDTKEQQISIKSRLHVLIKGNAEASFVQIPGDNEVIMKEVMNVNYNFIGYKQQIEKIAKDAGHDKNKCGMHFYEAVAEVAAKLPTIESIQNMLPEKLKNDNKVISLINIMVGHEKNYSYPLTQEQLKKIQEGENAKERHRQRKMNGKTYSAINS